MKRKYQFFISSTYEDMKEERDAVIHAVLTLNHFPIGMEMFSAADEEQWEIIREAIDSSDYYILIIGNRYGSVIEDGDEAGISYTEKEYNYASACEIPILAFLIDDAKSGFPLSDLIGDEEKLEKLKKLAAFKDRVKNDHKTVAFWKDAGTLEARVTQAIAKAVGRSNRPGWIRSTDFDVDKSLGEISRLTERVHMLEQLNADLRMETNRKPRLVIEPAKDPEQDDEGNMDPTDELCVRSDGTIHFRTRSINMSDINEKLIYKDGFGRECIAEEKEVRYFRHLCQNGFPIMFYIENIGDLKATGVRVRWEFPNELLMLSLEELKHYLYDGWHGTVDIPHAYEDWNRRFFAPEDSPENIGCVEGTDCVEKDNTDKDRFLSIDELITVDDIANLLDPADCNECVSIFPGEVNFDIPEIRHKDSTWVRGIYVLPTAPGEFEIACTILCNELPGESRQFIKVVVE